MGVERLSEFFKAAHTFLNQETGKIRLNQQPLRRTADVGTTIELSDLKIGR